ncbi:unnamed protein product [Leptosia nina]|uniref:Secreted protein n=1 Tax=Leptosia nina TaxID=320188 RepID=A0AAV1J8C1_9NEOP
MASEDARTLSAAPVVSAVSAVSVVSGVTAVSSVSTVPVSGANDERERPCACAGWPRRQPVHEILRPKPRSAVMKSDRTRGRTKHSRPHKSSLAIFWGPEMRPPAAYLRK